MYNNFQVFFSIKAKKSLSDFLAFMSETCRYRNSWLYNEEAIIENYIQDTQRFVLDVESILVEKLQKWNIGTIETETTQYIDTKLTTFIRSYTIICKCPIWKEINKISIEELKIRT